MPSTFTPIAARNSHSSTTWGSQAAWRISVTPDAPAAPSSAVSVPVTDASRRYTDAPVSPSGASIVRSEEHTSELQSQFHLVCRLLLEKKNHNQNSNINFAL